nr:hypothetical protein BN993_07015 [Virgibacillus halodenitrificans]
MQKDNLRVDTLVLKMDKLRSNLVGIQIPVLKKSNIANP